MSGYQHGGVIMNKMRLGTFTVTFAVLSIVFLLMFLGQGAQSEKGHQCPR